MIIEQPFAVTGDFENEYITYNADIGSNFVYQPQQDIDVTKGFTVDISNSILLESLPNLGTNLNIDWYRTDINGDFIYLNSGPTFNLTINTSADYGDYYYFVTSNNVPLLGLLSRAITIGPDPSTHPDYDALIALYNAFDGPNWTNPWDITTPIETWDPSFRLQFDDVTNRVVHFDYSGQNLTGIIPPEIGDLTELTGLWLFGNNITGEVPAEIWTLTNLRELVIGSQTSGEAYTPGALTLTNGIPSEIANLQQLEWLNLNGIALTLPLESEVYNLPNLIRIRLQDCGITGQLPAGLANISDVRVERNEFEGTIPTEILTSSGNLRLGITGNYFDFSDLEPLVSAANIQFLELSPQRTRDEEQTINSAPGMDITLEVNDTDITLEQHETAMNNEYQWFKDSIAIPGANANTYTILNAQEPDSGVYYCEITNSLVTDLIIRRADITLNIDATLSLPTDESNIIKIYPNPTSNWLNIHLATTTNTVITLFDINGKKVYNNNLNSSINAIDISHFDSGVYILNLLTDSKSITKRIIKK